MTGLHFKIHLERFTFVLHSRPGPKGGRQPHQSLGKTFLGLLFYTLNLQSIGLLFFTGKINWNSFETVFQSGDGKGLPAKRQRDGMRGGAKRYQLRGGFSVQMWVPAKLMDLCF